MFYAVTPNETSFAKLEEVPAYVDQVSAPVNSPV